MVEAGLVVAPEDRPLVLREGVSGVGQAHGLSIFFATGHGPVLLRFR